MLLAVQEWREQMKWRYASEVYGKEWAWKEMGTQKFMHARWLMYGTNSPFYVLVYIICIIFCSFKIIDRGQGQ